ncbi:MAG: hypothetical protein M1118_04095 [Chloroflexi bacterium]|nr:hypothetical protein [Chloroflexota bacterium]
MWEQRLWQERGAVLTVAVQAPAKPAHGRLERRDLWALGDPAWNGQVGELGTHGQPWPAIQQLWRLIRRRVDCCTGEISAEVTFGISSLSSERANATRLLRLIRRYWRSENRLHDVRDVSMGEDASQVRSGVANVAATHLRRPPRSLSFLAQPTDKEKP